jgi:Methyltransferase domain.
MTDHHYVFDGTKEQAELDRLRLLESAFDPQTRQRLENVGVSDGWHCLEVGAGAGSIMNWISEKVGSTGTVVAVDTDTRFLPSSVSSNTVIVKGDIRTVDLGRSRFDLVHGRYILLHIPEFASVLEKMLLLFKTGGLACLRRAGFLCRTVSGRFGRRTSGLRPGDECGRNHYKAIGINHTAGLKIPKALSALTRLS